MMRILFPVLVTMLSGVTLSCSQRLAYDESYFALPADFTYLNDARVKVTLYYAGPDNFVGRRLDGYEGIRALLRRDTAVGIQRAASVLEKRGLGLVITDAYRPRRAMEDIAKWAKTSDCRMKSRFYPNLTKAQIFEEQYIGAVSEHSWGVAVDVTLYRLSDGKLLDMGGHVDYLDPSSATAYAGLTTTQRKNRDLLLRTMQDAGFDNYDKEWWHYWIRSEQQPMSYDFPLRDNIPAAR